MANVQVLRRAAFSQCTSTLAEYGKSPNRVLTAAGIGRWHRGEPEEWVPLEAFLDAMAAGAATLGDPLFGITVARTNPMHFGTIGQAITRSPTLYIGMRTSAKLMSKLNTSGRMWLAQGPDTVWFCRAATHNYLLEQFALGHMISLVQMALGDTWMPAEVRLTATEDHGLQRDRLFDNVSVRTGQSCLAIAVPNSLISREIHAGLLYDPGSSPATERSISLPPDDLDGLLTEIVKSALSHQYPSLDSLCEVIGISKRTLQRQLARKGLSYREIVSKARFQKACKLLVETDMPINEIANALSYSKDTHFVRAFRHWAGITPSAFRHHSAHPSADHM